jgi:hypothetical protein
MTITSKRLWKLMVSPLGAVQNPGKIGCHEDLIKLLNSLVNSSCLWVILTKDELAEHKNKNKERQAHGEQVYKPRKQQTKCAKVTKESGAKSAEWVEDEEEEEEMGGDGAAIMNEEAAE